MIRGTTPTLEFTLPFDTGTLSEAFVTLAQGQTVVLDKAMSDCTCDGEKMTLRLTQEETLKLSANTETEIQVRVKTKSGDALASNIIRVDTKRILKDGVI